MRWYTKGTVHDDLSWSKLTHEWFLNSVNCLFKVSLLKTALYMFPI